MKIAEKSFTADGVEFPAGSFVIAAARGSRPPCARRSSSSASRRWRCRRCRRCRCTTPTCRGSRCTRSWTGHAGDRLGPLHARHVRHSLRPDLQGAREEGQPARRLRRDPDADADGDAPGRVPAAGRAPGALHEDARSSSSSGCTASRPTSPAAWAGKAWTRSRSSSNAGGTLIAMGDAVRLPDRLRLRAHRSTRRRRRRRRSTRRGRWSTPRSCRPEHPVFYGYTERIIPVEVPRRPAHVRRRVRPGRRAGAVRRRRRRGAQRPDEGCRRNPSASVRDRRARRLSTARAGSSCSRTIPIYRWQNHGEFNMVFNTLLNWNDLARLAVVPRRQARRPASQAAAEPLHHITLRTPASSGRSRPDAALIRHWG